jgi:type VI protein secretion system component VasF
MYLGIEVAYVEQTAIAESDYMIKKEKDKERLRLALYGFGAGIITISLVALILVLLSIHKYIKQLTETIDKLIIENKAKL